jgi:quercetin dioxygenase-like cupin family protein
MKEEVMSIQEIIRTDNVRVRTMELDTGSSTEWHFHSDVRDFIVCLEGVVMVELEDPWKIFVLYPGQHVEVDPPKVHRVFNNPVFISRYLLIQGVGQYDFIKA